MVQEHHARSLHWDLRLERDGVLVSWALPKGIPTDPKRTAWRSTSRTTRSSTSTSRARSRQGEYGAGKVKIWDTRHLRDARSSASDEVIVTFHGERLQGKYALFQTKGKNWMIHRMDPPADPGGSRCRSTSCRCWRGSSKLPARRPDWGFEIKWDGVRAIVYCEGGRVRLESRNLRDVTRAVPGAARAGPRARLAPGRARRRDRRVRRAGPPELRAPPAAHARRLGGGDAAAHGRHAGRLHDLRRALPRRPLDDGAALRPSAASCSRSSSWTGRHWQTPAYHVGRRRGDARGERASRASRAWSRSGSTAATSRASAAAPG